MAVKADDRLMMVLTAVVVAIALGTMVQKGEFIMAAFTSPDEYQPIEDAFSVRAGRPQTLDVLSNDLNVVADDAGRILVVSQPLCGSVRRVEGGLEYGDSETCGGTLSFTYCVPQGDACPSTTVNLSISLPEALDNRPALAASNFPTLRAPALAQPADAGQQIAPAEATAGLRQRPDSPSSISAPSMVAGSGMATQSSVGVSVGSLSSGFGQVPTLGAETAPSVGIARPGASATPRPATPELNDGFSVASVALPSRPLIQNPTAPAPSLGAQPSTSGIAATTEQPAVAASIAPAQPSASPIQAAPRVATSVSPQAPNANSGTAPVVASNSTEPPQNGVRRLRTLSSMFRPGQTSNTDQVQIATNDTARPSVTGIATPSSQPLITERAAQVLVPTQPSVSSSGSAPSLPTAPQTEQIALLDTPSVPALPRRSTTAAAPLRIESNAAPAEDVAPVQELASLAPEATAPVAPVTAPSIASCGVSVSVIGQPGEMLVADIMSACRPDTVVTVEHAGLMFDVLTNAAGTAVVEFPALAENAQVTVSFADGTSATSGVIVRNIDQHVRAGISWSTSTNLDLHAYEFSAVEDADTHIWEGNPRSYRESRRRGGGYLTVLGLEGGNRAEIYSITVSRRTPDGVVDMVTRIGPGAVDCSQPLQITTARNTQALSADNRNITLDISDCQANMTGTSFSTVVRDITIAQR